MVRQSARFASRVQRRRHVPDRRRGARPAQSFSPTLGIQRRVQRLPIELPDHGGRIRRAWVHVANFPTGETVRCLTDPIAEGAQASTRPAGVVPSDVGGRQNLRGTAHLTLSQCEGRQSNACIE